MIDDDFRKDPAWGAWSADTLRADADPVLVINAIIYAEVSVGFERIEELDDALPETMFRWEPLPWDGGFLAGKCFRRDRRRTGTKRSPLPDFYVGAHAAIGEMTLLTRDPKRYRFYFPGLTILSP